MNDTTEHPIFYWHDSPGNRFRVDVADFDEAAECAYCVPVYSAETVDRLRARVAELEAAKYGYNPSMVLLDEVHANGVDVDAIPISRLIAALDVLHRRVQERDDDGAATPGDLRAALRAIFNKGE